MFTIIYAEKIIAAAVMMSAIVVGVITINHGDLPLGLLVLLGQIQSLLAKDRHGIGHEATHIVVHNKL